MKFIINPAFHSEDQQGLEEYPDGVAYAHCDEHENGTADTTSMVPYETSSGSGQTYGNGDRDGCGQGRGDGGGFCLIDGTTEY
jgi:hypothetical protein